MSRSLRYLAIVTARSGSKRLPDKNALDLAGKPMFAWSVLAGRGCPEVARTIVSTDTERYREIALAYGAECPRLRASWLASDTASSADVVKDVLDHLDYDHTSYDGLVLLQPTSPMRTASDVTAAIHLHERSGAPAVVSVCEAECPPAWIGRLPDDLRMDEFVPVQYRDMRSQDIGTHFRLNGAVYVIGIDAFRAEHGFMPPGTLAHVMPRERSIDVDNALDFRVARLLMQDELAAPK